MGLSPSPNPLRIHKSTIVKASKNRSSTSYCYSHQPCQALKIVYSISCSLPNSRAGSYLKGTGEGGRRELWVGGICERNSVARWTRVKRVLYYYFLRQAGGVVERVNLANMSTLRHNTLNGWTQPKYQKGGGALSRAVRNVTKSICWQPGVQHVLAKDGDDVSKGYWKWRRFQPFVLSGNNFHLEIIVFRH